MGSSKNRNLEERIGEMEAIIGILTLCAVMVGGAAWLLNRPEHPKDPKEDQEQMEYLREWNKRHGKGTNEK